MINTQLKSQLAWNTFLWIALAWRPRMGATFGTTSLLLEMLGGQKLSVNHFGLMLTAMSRMIRKRCCTYELQQHNCGSLPVPLHHDTGLQRCKVLNNHPLSWIPSLK